MKTLLATLNAKYIHTSLALRWLYVANKDTFDIHFREYTIKEDIETIADDLLSTGCHCIGLGVYIWNVEKTKDLIRLLRQKNPSVILILGGPEVSYEPAHFLQTLPIDYVISGEGEFVLSELLHALKNDLPLSIPGISSQQAISHETARADLQKLSELPSPYQLPEDATNRTNRLLYFETSRGCPYQCSYCLSSLEKGVRYFPENYVKENLLYLIESDIRQIKFLDRTFNLDSRKTRYIFDFLIDHYRENLSCQFEIYADLLTDETIDELNSRLPQGFFRFEIGIQSTYGPSNKAVNRKQDFALISYNIHKLSQGGKIDLHLDLIAGLPYETYDRFIQSVNDVFAFRAKEFQLGFLKMLRGTLLRKEAAKHTYSYHEEAPYEVISNQYLSADEMAEIRKVENTIDTYWNKGRFTQTLHTVFDTHYPAHYFEFFLELAHFAKIRPSKAPSDTFSKAPSLEETYSILHQFLLSKDINLLDTLRNDYYKNFTFARRPTSTFWENTLDKKTRKQLLTHISADHDFLSANHLSPYAIQKQTTIDQLSDTDYLLTIFLPDGQKQLRYPNVTIQQREP